MPQGTVRWFDTDRGFGFLAPDDEGPDVFVHAKEILGEQRVLREGQVVEFEVGDGPRGPQATGVRATGDVETGGGLGVLATVSWYEPAKGYGFAAPDGGGPEVFVHSSAIVTGGVLAAGQRVAFVVVDGEKGPQAEHVIGLATSGPQSAPAAPTQDGADGTVAWYDEGKGFGFISPDSGGEDVFVHARALAEGLETLVEGDRVAFEAVSSERGPQARDLYLVVDATLSAATARSSSSSSSGGSSQRPPASSGVPARAGEGVVARYDAERGFGFITPDSGGDDLFVHVSVIQGGGDLDRGERVRFAVRQSDRGPQADRVERL